MLCLQIIIVQHFKKNIHNYENERITNLNSSFVFSPFTWKAFRKLLKDDTVFIATLCKLGSFAKKLIN